MRAEKRAHFLSEILSQMHFSKAIIFSTAALMLPLLGHATPLNQLSKGGSLSISGLTFDNFQAQVSHQGYAAPTNKKGIDVAAVSGLGNGIRFSSDFIADVPAAIAKKDPYFVSYADLSVSFDVKSTTGIDQIGLDFDGHATGLSMAGVDEMVFDGNGHYLGSLSVGCFGQAFGGGCQDTDTLSLHGLYNNLYIIKDMGVTSFGGNAGFSFVDQVFGTTATPEPASFALIGAGLIGVAGLLRRRTKNAQGK
ncbi:MAG TPA: PEP-CTERM sorting domain-containing protein [Bryobacteraceae bacterium]|nr:PEP-CTERM sorting domain-containing protein [Bryobacteraceae bacterium]